MTKSTKRKAIVTKNPDSVKFEAAPFYNLANIRKDLLALIVRASSDEKKVKAVGETLDVLSEFLNVRAKHGADVRAKTLEADRVAAENAALTAAAHKVSDAKARLRNGKNAVAEAEAILEALVPAPKA